MIQNSTCCLLVVTWSIPNYYSICWWHRHWTHTHWHYVRLIWIYGYRMILRHRRYNNILHDLTKFRGKILIKLTHGHWSHLWCFIHVANHNLLVRIMIIQLWSRLLQKYLTLSNSWSFLATVLRRLICTLICLIILLILLLHLLLLCWICI